MDDRTKLSSDEFVKKLDSFSMEVGEDNDLEGHKTLDRGVYFSPEELKNIRAGGFAASKISEVFSNILKK